MRYERAMYHIMWYKWRSSTLPYGHHALRINGIRQCILADLAGHQDSGYSVWWADLVFFLWWFCLYLQAWNGGPNWPHGAIIIWIAGVGTVDGWGQRQAFFPHFPGAGRGVQPVRLCWGLLHRRQYPGQKGRDQWESARNFSKWQVGTCCRWIFALTSIICWRPNFWALCKTGAKLCWGHWILQCPWESTERWLAVCAFLAFRAFAFGASPEDWPRLSANLFSFLGRSLYVRDLCKRWMVRNLDWRCACRKWWESYDFFWTCDRSSSCEDLGTRRQDSVHFWGWSFTFCCGAKGLGRCPYKDCCVFVFIDNEAAKASWITASAHSDIAQHVLHQGTLLEAKLNVWPYFLRVPTSSNFGDDSSRGRFQKLYQMGASRTDVCDELCTPFVARSHSNSDARRG